jgi:hypothetical protein
MSLIDRDDLCHVLFLPLRRLAALEQSKSVEYSQQYAVEVSTENGSLLGINS